MSTVISYLPQLALDSQKTEAEVMALAIEAGLRHLWRERTLGRYLHGQLSRAEAVEAVGIDWVQMAERQHQAMREDVEWATNQPASP